MWRSTWPTARPSSSPFPQREGVSLDTSRPLQTSNRPCGSSRTASDEGPSWGLSWLPPGALSETHQSVSCRCHHRRDRRLPVVGAPRPRASPRTANPSATSRHGPPPSAAQRYVTAGHKECSKSDIKRQGNGQTRLYFCARRVISHPSAPQLLR